MTNIASELKNTRIGLIYESFILVLFIFLLLLVAWRYHRKRTVYTKIMFGIFVSFSLGILFSWLSKLIVLILQIPNFDGLDPTMPGFFIVARIVQFRVSFIFMVIGAFLNYILKVKIFEEKEKIWERNLVYALSVATLGFSIIFVQQFNVLWDLIAFALSFLTLMVVYIPFTISSFKMTKKLHEKVYKNAAISLGIMGICFILILFSFLIDRLLMLINNTDGYSFFYFSAWAMAIFGGISAYIGYIRPEQKQKLNEETKPLSDEDFAE